MSVDGGLSLAVALGLPFALLAAVPALHRLDVRAPGYAGAAAGAAAFLALLLQWILGGPAEAAVPWIPSAGVAFVLRLDALSLLFASLVTGVGAVIFAYSAEYMAGERWTRPFYAYLALFMGAMLGLVLAGDLILLFVFWELTTLSSFLLIGLHREDPRSVDAALKALLITGLGGLALLLALLALALAAGSFDLATVLAAGPALRASPHFLPALLLFVVAVAAKSAQFPLHTWLPDAMVAPTPVSAYLHSAAMVKAGIYLLARFLPALVSVAWEAVLLPLGLVTMVLGGLLALRAVDLKRILAYSTISQLGLLVAAFGVGLGGQEGGLLHVLNHAVLKASLFLVAGAVTHATGVSDLRDLGGLRTSMPLTATACGLAALSLAGIPPLGGFLSKEVFFEAMLEGPLWAPILAVVGGGLTVAYSWNFFARIFLGRGETEAHEPLALAVPTLLLAAFTLVLGVFPDLATGTVAAAARGAPGAFHPSLLALKPLPATLSLLSLAIGAAVVWRYGAAARAVGRATEGLGRARPEGVYRAFVSGTQGVCRRIGLLVQNGSLSRYAGTLVLAVAAILALPLLAVGPLPPGVQLPDATNPRDVALAVVLAALVAFAVLAALLPETLHAVLALSGMGFLLATAFMLLNAPDLAMTQILVEMVFLVIFLIVLYKLPYRALKAPRRRGLRDVLLAAAVFLGVTHLVDRSLAAFDESVARFYLDPARFAETGGQNLVNVVVTDFRAFDTLGEITVIALAALAVYTLLRGWQR